MGPDDHDPIAGPPSDPEEWSDDQWLEWLKATDEHQPSKSPPATIGSRIARSTGGAVLGQAMLAMSQVIFGRRDDEVVIVVDSGSAPGDDEPYELHLDPEHPERSSVVFRPRPDELS